MGSKRNQFLVAIAVAALLQCSDKSPSRPSTVTPSVAPRPTRFDTGTILSVVSGESEGPVPNAEMTVEGVGYQTDESGKVALGQAASFGVLVDVVAQEFIERQTLARRDGMRFALWPASSPTGLDRKYTRALVYETAAVDADRELEPLQRPGFARPRVAVVPTEEIQNDPGAMEAIRRAVGEMNQALEGEIAYGVGEDPAAVRMTLEIDPLNEIIAERNFRAVIRCRLSRYTITSCAAVFRSMETVRTDTTLHELGHSFGLNHSPDPNEVMGSPRTGHPWRFSARERLAMRLMLERAPGNVFPDNDRDAAVFLTHAAERTIVCSDE